jgi:transposase-like protein
MWPRSSTGKSADLADGGCWSKSSRGHPEVNVILALLPEKGKARMTCHNCRTECARFGKHRNGLQLFRCRQCSKTFTGPHADNLEGMYLRMDRAEEILELMVEGYSISTIERFTGTHHKTILKLLVLAGEEFKRTMAKTVRENFWRRDALSTFCASTTTIEFERPRIQRASFCCDLTQKGGEPMLVPRGPDGRIGWPAPIPPQQSCPPPTFWDVVQKVSLLLGLVVSIRSLGR